MSNFTLIDLGDLLENYDLGDKARFMNICYDSDGLKGGTAIIRLYMNFYGYPSIRYAKNIVSKFNKKKKNDFELKFNSSFPINLERWSEPANPKPCFYIEKVPLNKDACEEAILIMLNAQSKLFKKI